MREKSLFTTRKVKKWRSHRYLIGAKAYLPPLPSAMWTSPSRSYIIKMSCKRATTLTPSLAMHRQFGEWKSSAFQQSFETFSTRRTIWKPSIAASAHWPTAIIFALANWWFPPSIPSKQELPSQKRDGSSLLLRIRDKVIRDFDFLVHFYLEHNIIFCIFATDNILLLSQRLCKKRIIY